MTDKAFEVALTEAKRIIAEDVDRYFRDRDDALNRAMHYALDGGKAIRGFLVLESARLHGVATKSAAPAAFAIECIHAYSLIHDDLPAMDDDDLRRGKPTVHKAWDDATAILAGDALQALAFECLASLDAPAEARLDLIASLAKASGRDGMVGGQMRDIAAERASEPLDLNAIRDVQKGKTGALLQWSASAGARLASASPAALERYGDGLGQAFQIADDLLDATGDAASMGKAVGKDADAGKATFVSLLGLEGAKRRAETLVTEACAALDCYGPAGRCLREAAEFVITRRT